MAFDLDNEELRATRKLHKINDDLYEETSDKNVGSIEDIRDLLLFFKSHGWIPDIRRTINVTNVILAIDNVLQEREQDKKRIQELEKELEKANKQLDLDYVDDNYIPKQKVKDKIELHKYYLLNQAITSNPTLDSHFRDKEKYVIQVLQKLLEGEK